MRNSVTSIAVWLFASLFAVYELFLTNGFYGVSLQLQQHDLNLSVNAVGSLAAISSLVYALCQIPAGIMVSKFSIRIILTFSTILVSIGMLIYSHANDAEQLILARVVIAIGSAFAFVSIAVLIGRWLDKDKFSLFFGLTQSMGNISVVSANMFLPQIINFLHGWKHTSLVLAIVGFILAIMMGLIVKSNPDSKSDSMQQTGNSASTLELFKQLAANKQFWLVTAYAGLLLGTLFNFGANWLIGFQGNYDSHSLAHSALVNSIMFLGVAVGNPVIGALSIKLQTRKKILLIGALASLILLSILILGPKFDANIALILYFLFGFSCSSAILSYSVIMEVLAPPLQGFGVGVCNTVVYLSGALLSTAIASIIRGEGASLHNVLTVDKIAFSLFCVAVAIAFALSSVIKESFRK